jgi:hypothetical protein
MRAYRYFLALSLFLLAGCNSSQWLDKMAPEQDVVLAKHYIDDLKNGEYSDIRENLDPALQSENVDSVFIKMAAAIPDAAPIGTKIVGVHLGQFENYKVVDITFEYSYPDNKWVVANVALKEQGDRAIIVGMHAYQLSDSLEHANRFTFQGKNIWHYIFFILAIIIPVFVLYTLIKCILEKGMQRKWLWIIFILLGFVEFVINWTTGSMTFKPIAVGLFGAGAMSQLYGPWIVSIYIPIGAILFWFRRMRHGKRDETNETGEIPESGLDSRGD